MSLKKILSVCAVVGFAGVVIIGISLFLKKTPAPNSLSGTQSSAAATVASDRSAADVRIADDTKSGLATVYYKGKATAQIPNGWGKYRVGIFRITAHNAYIYSCFKESKDYLLFGLCPRRIFQVNLTTGAWRNVIDGTRSYYDLAEDISPDEELAVLGRSDTPGPQSVLSVVVRSIGSEEEIDYPVADQEYNQLGDMRFSPDGSKVAYALARGVPGSEAGAVYMLDIESGQQKLVAKTDKPNTYMRVSGWKDTTTVEYAVADASALAP